MTQETPADAPLTGVAKRGRGLRVARRAAVVFGALALLWALAAVGVYLSAPAPPGAGETFDAIIVLGAGCVEDRPSKALEGRVRKGAQLYGEGRAPVLILTGGGYDEVAESACARTLALELGVPEGAILTEDRSGDTRENAIQARELTQGERVLVVSSDFHGYRAVRIFRGLFAQVSFEGSTSSAWRTVWGSVREPAGVLKMWWEGVPKRAEKLSH